MEYELAAAADHVYVRIHGGGLPQVVRLDDGRLALVKLQGNPQSLRALAGELIGTLLGRRVGAALPKPVLVAIDGERAERMARDTGLPRAPGLHFGTIYHREAAVLRTPTQVARLRNLDRLPVTALAEAWMYNDDLKRGHVLAVRAGGAAELRVVDHGHVFPGGPAWTPEGMAAHLGSAPRLLPLTRVARMVGGPFDFSVALAACEAVSDRDLAAIVAAVPTEWGLRPREADTVLDFLASRRRHLARWAGNLAAGWGGG